MVGISFNYFLQFKQPLPSSFKFANKANLIFANITFFVFLNYAFIFYLLVYRFCKKNQAKIILNS
jgi:hypothetical protein